MTELTPQQRRAFRAQAHHLDPVVSIAGNGLTESVLKEIERSLQAHELIKVKVQGADREARQAYMDSICEQLEAAPVQQIGGMLVLWREREEEEAKEKKPRRKPARLTKKKAQARRP